MTTMNTDFVAIDVNVFEHLLNPAENIDGHITDIVGWVLLNGVAILVDSRRRIEGEYANRLVPYLQGARHKSERVLLERLLRRPKYKRVQVDAKDALMTGINNLVSVASHKSNTDRYYVYVAFKAGRVLITNDKADILDNRRQLKRQTKRWRAKQQEDILSSREAYAKLPPN